MFELDIYFITLVILLYFTLHYTYNSILPRIKGKIGESLIASRLDKLNRKHYRTFNNIYIKVNNRSSQIDHLVISVHGIFVIETKHYKGWIHGHEKSEYWTQSIYKHKRQLFNPIRENWSHVSTLKTLFPELGHGIYHPIVVFSGSAKLKNVYSRLPVIRRHELLRTIKREKHIYLSEKEVEDISNRLVNFIITDKKKIKNHKNNTKRYIYQKKKNVKSLICPRCKGKLVVRKGKYGKFYGCLNFPKCRFSKKI